MNDIVKLYNPANAASLTPEDLKALQSLSSAEIKELALAYPNSVMQRGYLLIIDGSKPVEKQLPSLSSFENLWNLREKNGFRNFVAYGFKGVVKPVQTLRSKTQVLDLSEQELMTLPGFKTEDKEIPSEEVTVKKVRKTKQ